MPSTPGWLECNNDARRSSVWHPALMQRANDILEYWFGTGDWTPARLAERTTFWFGGDGARPRRLA